MSNQCSTCHATLEWNGECRACGDRLFAEVGGVKPTQQIGPPLARTSNVAEAARLAAELGPPRVMTPWKMPPPEEADPEGYAEGRYGPPSTTSAESPAEASLADQIRAKILTRAQLRSIPPARYLIRGVLDLDSESWLIGESQAFKSFVAIDWACHVATDAPWRGRKVRTGPVLYVVAEGVKGFAKRVDAWEIANKTEATHLMILPAPVQAKGGSFGEVTVSAQWRALCEVAAEMKPVLIVLDTQARMTVGLEENSNTAMGVWTEAIRLMREATSACVLVVHHIGRNGRDARGASALDGAQDAEWKVVRTDMRKMSAKLQMDKNKDGSNDLDFDFEAVVVDLGVDEEGDPVTSLTLRQISSDLARHLRDESAAEDASGFDYDYNVKLTANQAEAMAVLREVVTERGETLPVILRLVNERRRERAEKTGTEYAAMARTSLTRALESLESSDLVKPANKAGTRFVAAAKWADPDGMDGGDGLAVAA